MGTVSPSMTMSWDPWSSPCSHMHSFCFCHMPLNQCDELGAETTGSRNDLIALGSPCHQWPSRYDPKISSTINISLLIYTIYNSLCFLFLDSFHAVCFWATILFLAGEKTQGFFFFFLSYLPHSQKNRPPLIDSMWSIPSLSRIPKKPWASTDWPVSKQPCLRDSWGRRMLPLSLNLSTLHHLPQAVGKSLPCSSCSDKTQNPSCNFPSYFPNIQFRILFKSQLILGGSLSDTLSL